MPIKLDVDIQHFAITARNVEPPRCSGDIVYGWDDNSPVLVIGAHRGYDDEYDPETGKQIKHRHKILIMSWEKQDIMSFDYVATVPKALRARVITPDGTGILESVNDNGICVYLDKGIHERYSNPDNVQLFSWDRVNAAKTSND